ncbi:MAG: CPBP family intramembrane metalloprotease [Planctomycetes bacterium]|nr:CPBP family intramembrane metalloprotease [Planctomycetota bacterium]
MKPLSDKQAVPVLLRIAWCRTRQALNEQLTLKIFSWKKKKDKERTATSGKKRGGTIGVAFFSVMMLFGFGMFGMQAVKTVLSSIAEPETKEASITQMKWGWGAQINLGREESLWQEVNRGKAKNQSAYPLDEVDCHTSLSLKGGKKIRFPHMKAYVRHHFDHDSEDMPYTESEKWSYIDACVEHYERYGSTGFCEPDVVSSDEDTMIWYINKESRLRPKESIWDTLNKNRLPGQPPRSLKEAPCRIGTNDKMFTNYEELARELFRKEAEKSESSQEDIDLYVNTRLHHYTSYGPDGFKDAMDMFRSTSTQSVIFTPYKRPQFRSSTISRQAVGLLSFFMTMSILFIGGQMGMVKKAGKREALDDLEWTMTYPISSRAILIAQLLRITLFDITGWVLLLPVFFFVYIAAGFGIWTILLVPLTTFGVKAMCGGLSLLLQVVIPLLFPPKRAALITSLMATSGMICYFGFLFLAQGKSPLPWIATISAAVPHSLLYLPPFAPGLLTAGGLSIVWGLLSIVGGGMGIGLFAVSLSSILIQRGKPLVSNDNRRSQSTSKTAPLRTIFSGNLRVSLLLLYRNRPFLLQVILIPLVLLAFNGHAIISGWLSDPSSVKPEHIAAIAYGVGAYASIFSASNALHSKNMSLWFLHTLPRSIGSMLLAKTMTNGSICLLHPILVLGTASLFIPITPYFIWLSVIALCCSAAMASITGGIFTLGLNPHTTEKHKTVGGIYIMGQMLLMGMPMTAFYSNSPWSQLCTLFFLWLIGFALWQRVHEKLPYIMDPVEEPPPLITIADGLIAACLFFFLQMLVMLFSHSLGAPLSQALLFGFLGGGILALSLSLCSFYYRGIPNKAQLLGFAPLDKGKSFLTSLLTGLCAGLVASAIGAGYLYTMSSVDILQPFYQAIQESAMRPEVGDYAFYLLIVVAAPIIEEPLFRGIIYNGVSRRLSPGKALLLSSFIFAVVHPVFSVFPVFFLGILTTLTYRKTGRLESAIITHAVYNAAILYMGPCFS